VEFENGDKIQYFMPAIKLNGLIMGDRLVKYHGTMKFIDYKNCLKGIINFGEKEKINFFQTNKKNNIIKGKIYRIKKKPCRKFSKKLVGLV